MINAKDEDDSDDEARDENALTYDQLFTFKIKIFFEMLADDINEHREEQGSAESCYAKQSQNEKVVETIALNSFFYGLLALETHTYNEHYHKDRHCVQADTCKERSFLNYRKVEMN